MEYTGQDHTFAIPAWGKSDYLEECIRSLKNQTVKGRIILCTSTPNEHTRRLARMYGLDLYVREGNADIAEDWNFAYAKTDTPLITLAHQDDVYDPRFLELTLQRLSREKRPLISFCDYYELRSGERVDERENRNLRIKKWMLFPLRSRLLGKSRWCRRRILSLGSPICCPSVTYVRENLPEPVFQSGFQADLDWQAWERLSRLKGSFCYLPGTWMGHRIHSESATTRVIGEDRNRSREDLEMFRMFWPEGLAQLLNRFYSVGQDENQARPGNRKRLHKL